MTLAGVDVTAVVVRSDAARRRVRRALPGVEVRGAGAPLPPAGGLLIAVPDRAVAVCGAALAAAPPGRLRTVLHTSGLLPAAALAPLAGAGVRLGALHPLVSFPSAGGALVPLGGVFAAVEGETPAVRDAAALARRLGMRPHRIEASAKPAYHAAAAVAGNLAHALVVAAREQLVLAGIPASGAAAALAPLVEGAAAAALAGPPWHRLTGPVARGDAATVSAHLAALPPELAAVYRETARLMVTRLTAEGLLENSLADDVLAALTAPR